MKSSLEIAQEAELIPIDQIAENCGLEPEDIEPFKLERFYTDELVSELAAAAVSH